MPNEENKKKTKLQQSIEAGEQEGKFDFLKELEKHDDIETMKSLVSTRRDQLRVDLVNIGSLFYAGALSKIATGPLERMKLILQTQSVWRQNPAIDLKETKFFGLVKEIRTEQGFKSLWRGTAANVIKTLPTSLLRVAIFDQLKLLIMYKGDIYYKKPERYLRTTIASFFGCLLSNLFVYPLERIRVIMSLNMTPLGTMDLNKGVATNLMSQMRNEGFPSLYRGYLLNSWVTVPYTAVTLGFYDIYREYLFKQGYFDLYSRYTLIGLATTFTTQLVTYPLDTVRRLLQADSTIVLPNKAYGKAWDCFKKVRKSEGITGLYKGFLVNSIKTPIHTVIQLISYEYMRRTLEAITKHQ